MWSSLGSCEEIKRLKSAMKIVSVPRTASRNAGKGLLNNQRLAD
jgi:hypothetical protein